MVSRFWLLWFSYYRVVFFILKTSQRLYTGVHRCVCTCVFYPFGEWLSAEVWYQDEGGRNSQWLPKLLSSWARLYHPRSYPLVGSPVVTLCAVELRESLRTKARPEDGGKDGALSGQRHWWLSSSPTWKTAFLTVTSQGRWWKQSFCSERWESSIFPVTDGRLPHRRQWWQTSVTFRVAETSIRLSALVSYCTCLRPPVLVVSFCKNTLEWLFWLLILRG